MKKRACENCGIESPIKKDEEELDLFYCLNCRAQ